MTTTSIPPKRKTTIEIDVQLLAQAQEVLGTKGIKDTIDKAFDEVWRAHLRRRFIERIRTQRGIDIGPEFLAEVRANWTKQSDD